MRELLKEIQSMMFVRDGRIWASDTPAEKCPALASFLAGGEMPQGARKAFEHKVVRVVSADWEKEVETLGSEGWEAYGVIPGTNGGYSRIMLKREKPETP